MTTINANLDGGRFLANEFAENSVRAAFFQKIIASVNKVAQAAGVGASGNKQAPPPIDNINVNSSGEMMHVTLSQNGKVDKNAHYFLEISNNPNFSQPLVKHFGPSRAPEPFTLPTMNGAGVKQTYYLRAYNQYPGSDPSTITTLGGPLNPQGVTLSGTTKMDLLPSTGSGTSSTTGQQPGQGFGKSSTQQVVTGPQKAAINAVTPVK